MYRIRMLNSFKLNDNLLFHKYVYSAFSYDYIFIVYAYRNFCLCINTFLFQFKHQCLLINSFKKACSKVYPYIICTLNNRSY